MSFSDFFYFILYLYLIYKATFDDLIREEDRKEELREEQKKLEAKQKYKNYKIYNLRRNFCGSRRKYKMLKRSKWN